MSPSETGITVNGLEKPILLKTFLRQRLYECQPTVTPTAQSTNAKCFLHGNDYFHHYHYKASPFDER